MKMTFKERPLRVFFRLLFGMRRMVSTALLLRTIVSSVEDLLRTFRFLSLPVVRPSVFVLAFRDFYKAL